MTEKTIFLRDSSVPIYCEYKDANDAYANPTQGIKITIVDPDGTEQVSEVAMTNTATGKYVYYYESSSSDTAGWWCWQCDAVDGAGANARTTPATGSFKLI